jgi:5'-nucleotidase (lipoprotein e(P4) family)
MIGAMGNSSRRAWLVLLVLVAALGCAGPQIAPQTAASAPPPAAQKPEPPASDLLNAVLWMQRSVEYKASALTAFALARIRLDQALEDRNWTAAPKEQTGAYQSLPPAVILDVDESILDNSGYQAWMALKGTSFDAKTWNAFVNTLTSTPIPGALEFAKYADSKGVKVFYVSNRTAEEEPATRKNLEKFGFPMGGGVDTMLMTRKQPDWGSAKGTRRAFVAKSYRVLLNVGDNLGDFVDDYRGTEAERMKVLEQHRERWGREWIVIANPAYGSFESAPFGHDFKLSDGERRRLKRAVLDAWPGP